MKKLLLILAIPILLIGCKTKYITQTQTRVELQEKYIRDSVYVKDSIYITRLGDTVYFSKYKIYYKNLIKRDTVNLRDTILIPVETTKFKEVNRLTSWQATRLKLFDLLIATLSGAILYIFRKPLIKAIKRIFLLIKLLI